MIHTIHSVKKRMLFNVLAAIFFFFIGNTYNAILVDFQCLEVGVHKIEVKSPESVSIKLKENIQAILQFYNEAGAL
ncbi:hypothetical protein [Cellulosilyticum sp. WCF-2]|uniref:hypothetical protein n=1 Tax=Cellulosilyticum sp. WCF-2 TaxID=2497860 RepID=UPI000F8EBD48|nr:hypothetical protein [Cellulosilyticum sp. WCF-2]QEH70201.1 hypothetical protein EKH84_18120 [Cellulosilyticum sp. WCF-2]